MKKFLTIPLELKVIRHPGQAVLNVLIKPEALLDWSLALCLLKEGLIEVLSVGEKGTNRKLELRPLHGMGSQIGSQAIFESERTRVAATVNDLELLVHFFLKYHRDGAAEVDHIDLDVAAPTEGQDASITFKVSEARPHVDAEEARRRLGLA